MMLETTVLLSNFLPKIRNRNYIAQKLLSIIDETAVSIAIYIMKNIDENETC